MINLKIKGSKVQLNGSEISGNTYPIKQWIKTYLNGKWDGERKSWIVETEKVKTWMGTCIQLDNNTVTKTIEPHKSNWFVNTKGGRELAEDY